MHESCKKPNLITRTRPRKHSSYPKHSSRKQWFTRYRSRVVSQRTKTEGKHCGQKPKAKSLRRASYHKKNVQRIGGVIWLDIYRRMLELKQTGGIPKCDKQKIRESEKRTHIDEDILSELNKTLEDGTFNDFEKQHTFFLNVTVKDTNGDILYTREVEFQQFHMWLFIKLDHGNTIEIDSPKPIDYEQSIRVLGLFGENIAEIQTRISCAYKECCDEEELFDRSTFKSKYGFDFVDYEEDDNIEISLGGFHRRLYKYYAANADGELPGTSDGTGSAGGSKKVGQFHSYVQFVNTIFENISIPYIAYSRIIFDEQLPTVFTGYPYDSNEAPSEDNLFTKINTCSQTKFMNRPLTLYTYTWRAFMFFSYIAGAIIKESSGGHTTLLRYTVINTDCHPLWLLENKANALKLLSQFQYSDALYEYIKDAKKIRFPEFLSKLQYLDSQMTGFCRWVYRFERNTNEVNATIDDCLTGLDYVDERYEYKSYGMTPKYTKPSDIINNIFAKQLKSSLDKLMQCDSKLMQCDSNVYPCFFAGYTSAILISFIQTIMPEDKVGFIIATGDLVADKQLPPPYGGTFDAGTNYPDSFAPDPSHSFARANMYYTKTVFGVMGVNNRYISTVSVKDLHEALKYAKLTFNGKNEPENYDRNKLEQYKYDKYGDKLSSPTADGIDVSQNNKNTLRNTLFHKQRTWFEQMPDYVKVLLTEPFSVLIGFFPLRRRVGVDTVYGNDFSDSYVEYIFSHCFFPEEIVCIIIPKEKKKFVQDIPNLLKILSKFEIELLTFEEVFPSMNQ